MEQGKKFGADGSPRGAAAWEQGAKSCPHHPNDCHNYTRIKIAQSCAITSACGKVGRKTLRSRKEEGYAPVAVSLLSLTQAVWRKGDKYLIRPRAVEQGALEAGATQQPISASDHLFSPARRRRRQRLYLFLSVPLVPLKTRQVSLGARDERQAQVISAPCASESRCFSFVVLFYFHWDAGLGCSLSLALFCLDGLSSLIKMSCACGNKRAPPHRWRIALNHLLGAPAFEAGILTFKQTSGVKAVCVFCLD